MRFGNAKTHYSDKKGKCCCTLLLQPLLLLLLLLLTALHAAIACRFYNLG